MSAGAENPRLGRHDDGQEAAVLQHRGAEQSDPGACDPQPFDDGQGGSEALLGGREERQTSRRGAGDSIFAEYLEVLLRLSVTHHTSQYCLHGFKSLLDPSKLWQSLPCWMEQTSKAQPNRLLAHQDVTFTAPLTSTNIDSHLRNCYPCSVT